MVECDSLNRMQLILTALDEPLAKAWRRFCGDLDFVEVHLGSILDVACDAVVSPANSFGFMDGGVDAAYLRYFGRDIERRVRQMIAQKHSGELLVGAADVVETGDDRIPFMIVAPTMRVPMILHDSVNAYLAARAVFLLQRFGTSATGAKAGQSIARKIERIAFPGLGTGVGRLGPNTCARQMRAAIDAILLDQYSAPGTWAEASERHRLLYTDLPHRLQSEK
jgi:O-acetyl-ADP-ribose deacetylase (regulator of RNase III)